MPNHEVAQGPSDVVGDRLRELRRQQQLSVDDLAARCEEVGAPELTDNAIYAIEGGRRKAGARTRKITVDELFSLACALRVSPIALLMPTDPVAYAVTPNREASTTLRLYDWIIGRTHGLPFGEQDPSSGQDAVPAGLPAYLDARERQLIAERDVNWPAWEAKVFELGIALASGAPIYGQVEDLINGNWLTPEHRSLLAAIRVASIASGVRAVPSGDDVGDVPDVG